jgi:membrane protein required for colicin V production
MNWIDIACAACLLVFSVLGLWRGLLSSVFRLCAWISAILGAYFAQDLLCGFFIRNFAFGDFAAHLICTCIGFLVPFLFFLFVGHFLQHITEGTKVGKADRILGGIFGVIKALLICFVLLTILHLFPFGGIVPETRDNAFAYDAYKATLELMGYSSEPVDLLEVAEKKASEVVKNATDKAAGKAAEAAKDVADKAVEKATEAAKETVKGAVSNAVDSLKK